MKEDKQCEKDKQQQQRNIIIKATLVLIRKKRLKRGYNGFRLSSKVASGGHTQSKESP